MCNNDCYWKNSSYPISELISKLYCKCEVTFIITQFVTGHENFGKNLHRFKIEESNDCPTATPKMWIFYVRFTGEKSGIIWRYKWCMINKTEKNLAIFYVFLREIYIRETKILENKFGFICTSSFLLLPSHVLWLIFKFTFSFFTCIISIL